MHQIKKLRLRVRVTVVAGTMAKQLTLSNYMIDAFYKKTVLFLVVIALFCGCSSNPNNKAVISLPDKLTYAGKGAAAGIALMGVLGPSGIAIGAAIDVGIGKDIQSLNDPSLLRKGIEDIVLQYNSAAEINYIQKLIITDITFKPVTDDLATVTITAQAYFTDESVSVLTSSTLNTPFEQLITKNEAGNLLIFQSLNNAFNNL